VARLRFGLGLLALVATTVLGPYALALWRIRMEVRTDARVGNLERRFSPEVQFEEMKRAIDRATSGSGR
jgi:hypothetical protein